MDQALWRMSYFAQSEPVVLGAEMTAITSILDVAASRAMDMQARVGRSSESAEPFNIERSFNQKLVERITRQHISYWNAPLTDARMAS